MHVLFVHQNFPAQFRYLAPRLVAEHGWRCTFLTARAEGSLPGVDKLVYRTQGGATKANHICTRNFENAVHEAHAVYEALKARPDVQPDLIVAHTGFGSSLFIPYLYDAPIINFLEYFYRPIGQDLGFRPELPVTEETLLRIKTKNAMILLDVENCDRGWTPTTYQREFFPPEWHSKIDVIFDGIDTSIYHRKLLPERRVPGHSVVPADTKIVTYVARGFERMRGFDIFMEVARRVYEQFPNVLFVVVGSDRVHYGPDLNYTPEASFREHVLATGKYDLSKFLFTGWVSEDDLATILSLTDLHIYLTEPFIASWSMVDAMSCGAVVLASDQRCVREYIVPEENGLLAGFFDVEGLAARALDVLRHTEAYRPLTEAAQRLVAEKYSVDVALPKLKTYFERVAAKRRERSTRAALLVREGTVQRVVPEGETRQSAQAHEAAKHPALAVAVPAAASAAASRARTACVRRPAIPGKDPDLDSALERLNECCQQCSTIGDWIGVCSQYAGPTGFENLDIPYHPQDIARFMQRILEWQPRRILDLGSTTAGLVFLWTRVAADDARIVAAGLPRRAIPARHKEFMECLAWRQQSVQCLPEVSNRDALIAELNRLRGYRLFDVIILHGQQPAQELAADFDCVVKLLRKGGLVAWDGVRPSGTGDPSEGGTILWNQVKSRFTRKAEYLAGVSSPGGCLVAVCLN